MKQWLIFFTFQLEWRDLMKEDAAVKKSIITAENHAKYIASRKGGLPDYDMLM